MKLFISILILLLMSSGAVLSQKIHETVPALPDGVLSPPDPLFDREVSRGIELTFTDRYEESLALFDSLTLAYPDHPAPYFFHAASYQNLMTSYRITVYQVELEKYIQLAIKKGEQQLKTSEDPWLNFYVGAAYGYRGFNRFRKHNWIGAYKDGKRGISNFKKALEKDSTLYDVYLGLGSYFYWRTAKSKFIKIIAFWMSDKRELGLAQLQFAREHGRYAAHEAGYVLLTALFDAKRFPEADSVLQELIAQKSTPANTDLYFAGRLAVRFQKWPEVIRNFEALYQRLRSYPIPSYSYQAECMYWTALAKKNLEDTAAALLDVRLAKKLSDRQNPEREMEGLLEKNSDIRKKINKLHKELARIAGE